MQEHLLPRAGLIIISASASVVKQVQARRSRQVQCGALPWALMGSGHLRSRAYMTTRMANTRCRALHHCRDSAAAAASY